MKRKYKVVTLCGSSRFKEDFIRVSEELSLKGNIVIGLGLYCHADNKYNTVITDEVKAMLDEAHRQKIDMSDGIYVINPGGYIGEFTMGEIQYAADHGKEIIYMVQPRLEEFNNDSSRVDHHKDTK